MHSVAVDQQACDDESVSSRRAQSFNMNDAGCYWYVLLKLGSDASAYYGYLIARCMDKDHCWPSIATIARDLRMGEKTVRKLRDQLAGHGFIRCEKHWDAQGDRAPDRVFVRELEDESFRIDMTGWATKAGEERLRANRGVGVNRTPPGCQSDTTVVYLPDTTVGVNEPDKGDATQVDTKKVDLFGAYAPHQPFLLSSTPDDDSHMSGTGAPPQTGATQNSPARARPSGSFAQENIFKASKTEVPEDFWPSAEDLHWAAELTRLSQEEIDTETNQFRDWHLAKGIRRSDWIFAWRDWMLNAKPVRRPANRPVYREQSESGVNKSPIQL